MLKIIVADVARKARELESRRHIRRRIHADRGIGAFLFAFFKGHVRTWCTLLERPVDSVETSAILFAVIFGALVFANFIILSGLQYDLLDIVDATQMSSLGIVLFVCAVCMSSA